MRNTAFTFFILLLSFSSYAQNAVEEIRKKVEDGTYPNIDGIVVAQNNTILIEAYFNEFGEDDGHDLRSSFKSVISLLAGIAIDQGLMSVDDPLSKYFPELASDERGEIQVKDLLQMSSGLACEEFFGVGPDCESAMWDTDNWLAYNLSVPIRHTAGLNWEYSSLEPDLVGEVIARASEMPLVDFASKNLFEPLGISGYRWYITPEGRGYGGGSFMMKPKDMLKIAQMVLDEGIWDGQQIVSKDWLSESTTTNIDVEMSFVRFGRVQNAKYATANYGYFWYREKLQFNDIDTEVLFASGNGGQYMMILEDYNAAIAFTGSNYGSWRGKLPFDILVQYIIPMLKE